MNGNFEIDEYEILISVTTELVNSLTTEQLISYMDKFSGRYGITHEMYSDFCEMYVNGEIKLIKSSWKKEPESWTSLPKTPKFIHKENFKKTKELRKNKRDWENHWREYNEKYPVRDESCNKAEFWMGEDFSRNAFLHINKTYSTEIKLKKFQFMIEVVDQDKWSGYGQEYVFKFVGDDAQTKFVEKFRRKICNDIAKKLISKRHDQLLEEETKKTVALFGTIFEEEKEVE